MKNSVIGLESSSIMPLVAITPLTQECYENLWDEYINNTLIAHEDSIFELKNIFKFKANTFYSNPIVRLEKIKDFPRPERMSLKFTALKLLLDGQMGGWIGNKNSRVQTFFFSDVIDTISDTIKDPKIFSKELTERMKSKIKRYNQLLTPQKGVLAIDIRQILSYWGFHNVSPLIFAENRKIKINILPDCESFEIFNSYPSATRRDVYHYHMLKKEKVKMILVGDANYKKNICSCKECNSFNCEVKIIKDTKRKKLLGLI
jgi:hypothetical protein